MGRDTGTTNLIKPGAMISLSTPIIITLQNEGSRPAYGLESE